MFFIIKYASNKKLSLSRLIENYLDSITREQNDEFEISPFVRSISTGNFARNCLHRIVDFAITFSVVRDRIQTLHINKIWVLRK